ncbi:MAG: hypothetical protein QHG98_07490 [Methanothrix sp.]|jgi:hypothetical protein|nr:hypothetical protein [Methanothrix sp.]
MSAKLTRDLIVLGSQFRKTVHVQAYDADVDVRPLKTRELAQIVSALGYTIDEAMGELVTANISSDSVDRLRNGVVDETVARMVTRGALSEKFMRYMIEMCRYGIVDDDVRAAVDDLIGLAAVEIGAAIMSLTFVPQEHILDFFRAMKDSTGQQSTPQDTGSVVETSTS